jgi:hypothetical protein
LTIVTRVPETSSTARSADCSTTFTSPNGPGRVPDWKSISAGSSFTMPCDASESVFERASTRARVDFESAA